MTRSSQLIEHYAGRNAGQRPRELFRAVLAEYQAHYNSARPHQGIAQRVPDAGRDTPRAAMTDLDIERIRRRPVLNGLINEYAHAA